MKEEKKASTAIKVSHNPPPEKIYDRARAQFGSDVIDFERGTMFAYGDTIHAKRPIDPDFFVHESTHCKIQLSYEGSSDAWWEKYFTDKSFRFEQELMAYRAQYRFLCTKVKDRNKQNRFLIEYAADLSGGLYGNLVGSTEAGKLIRQ